MGPARNQRVLTSDDDVDMNDDLGGGAQASPQRLTGPRRGLELASYLALAAVVGFIVLIFTRPNGWAIRLDLAILVCSGATSAICVGALAIKTLRHQRK